MFRRFWEGTVLESIGGTWLGVGAGVAAALLLMPPVRRQVAEWGGQLSKGLKDILSEAWERPGLVAGAAALAAGGAAVTAPTGGAGAAAATAAPTAAVMLPVALEAVERGLEAKRLVEDLTGKKQKAKDK